MLGELIECLGLATSCEVRLSVNGFLGRRGSVESPYFTIAHTSWNIARQAFSLADLDAGFGKSNQVISRSANLFFTASTVLPLGNVVQTITSHRLVKNSFRLLSVRSLGR
jgi:hypothetical protein